MAMTFEELDKGIHERRLEIIEKRQDKQDDALAEMNAHIGDVDRRQAKLEGIIEEISGTLAEIKEGTARIEKRAMAARSVDFWCMGNFGGVDPVQIELISTRPSNTVR